MTMLLREPSRVQPRSDAEVAMQQQAVTSTETLFMKVGAPPRAADSAGRGRPHPCCCRRRAGRH